LVVVRSGGAKLGVLMARLLFLIQVSRPVAWFFLPMVYYLGMRQARAEVTAAALVQMALLTFPMNLIGCGLNDIYDLESDRASRRKRWIWGAVVEEPERPVVWRWVLGMMPLVLGGAVLTGNAWNVAATALHLSVAWAYSVPPIRLKERPPLDSLANGLGYFLFPFAMGFSLGASPLAMQLKHYLLALSVCGVHAMAAAADYEHDRAAGHRTIAVACGPRAAVLAALTTFLISWLLGGFRGRAVHAFFAVIVPATVVAALVPRRSVISAACILIVISFLIAAVWHAWLW
jgi:4-hydroxybenzoate polyprenyltransferase